MLSVRRRAVAATVGAVMGISAGAVPALAWVCPPPPPPPAEKVKCNAGNGNGSESTAVDPTGHCTNGDPGNSFAAGNKGGDETDFPGSVDNPGGNNSP
jgi:hypothetical protein